MIEQPHPHPQDVEQLAENLGAAAFLAWSHGATQGADEQALEWFAHTLTDRQIVGWMRVAAHVMAIGGALIYATGVDLDDETTAAGYARAWARRQL